MHRTAEIKWQHCEFRIQNHFSFHTLSNVSCELLAFQSIMSSFVLYAFTITFSASQAGNMAGKDVIQVKHLKLPLSIG